MHTYIHSCMHACMHAYMHARMHACVRTIRHCYLSCVFNTIKCYCCHFTIISVSIVCSHVRRLPLLGKTTRMQRCSQLHVAKQPDMRIPQRFGFQTCASSTSSAFFGLIFCGESLTVVGRCSHPLLRLLGHCVSIQAQCRDPMQQEPVQTTGLINCINRTLPTSQHQRRNNYAPINQRTMNHLPVLGFTFWFHVTMSHLTYSACASLA